MAYRSVNPFDGKVLQTLAVFFSVKVEDETVTLANNSPQSSGASDGTWDIACGKRVAGRIETSMVFVTHPAWTAPDLPFGGIREYGRDLSGVGISAFVSKKLVRVAALHAPA